MIELTDLTKAYGRGNQRTVVLDAINFRVDTPARSWRSSGPAAPAKARWPSASTC
jgi:hypothetical protein